jgi:catabolite regulation protein CreA
VSKVPSDWPEDKSEASIACRQVEDSVRFTAALPIQGDVFTERMSVLFKRLHIVRVVDPKSNALVYLTYSDKLVDGSPKNSVTAVAVPRSNPIHVRQFTMPGYVGVAGELDFNFGKVQVGRTSQHEDANTHV